MIYAKAQEKFNPKCSFFVMNINFVGLAKEIYVRHSSIIDNSRLNRFIPLWFEANEWIVAENDGAMDATDSFIYFNEPV